MAIAERRRAHFRIDDGIMTMATRTNIQIRRERLDSPTASALITALDAELSAIYPEDGGTHFRLDLDEVAEGRGAFFVAYHDGAPVGCGAIRRLGPQVAELKRMYVTPGERGRGVGRAILAALEEEAYRLGARRLVLETGERQRDALALYARAGFELIPRFGEYLESPLSICLAKDTPSSSTS